MKARPGLAAFAVYVVAALAMTWPLVRGLARDIPQDLADPLLNCWVLSWVSDRLRLALSGDFAALRDFWNANIFYPEPRALAYSEHLLAQALQILPLRLLGAGLVLCYNLLFLETFVLSALGMYLLARDLTGNRMAAFVAGLLFGFAPYRMDQFAHLQVLTSQWMPFALLGLRRYVATGRSLPLVGATAALVAQAFSCGYHLLFFTPFAAAWAMHQMWAHGRARNLRRWLSLALAAVVMAMLVVPFLLPYLEVRRAGAIYRGVLEVDLFSADVYAYLSAPENLRFWGERLRLEPGPESSLFPGLVPIVLAVVGLVAVVRRTWRGTAPAAQRDPRTLWVRVRRVLVWVAAGVAAIHLLAFGFQLLGGGLWPDLIVALRIRSATRLLTIAAWSSLALLLLSRRVRSFVLVWARTTEGFAAGALVLAAWLSLGPHVRTFGQEIYGIGLYGWLYAHIPGFDGLRVPGRYATVVVLFLAVLGAYGAAGLARRLKPVGLACVGALFLLESTAAPIMLNDVWSERRLLPPANRALLGEELPAIYRDVMRLPEDAVLLELPFGSYPYELHYMLYSTEHRRRLVNGTSGAFPRSYLDLRSKLLRVLPESDRVWETLRGTVATHVIVHEHAFRGRRGRRLTAWMKGHGARVVAQRGKDVLFALRP